MADGIYRRLIEILEKSLEKDRKRPSNIKQRKRYGVSAEESGKVQACRQDE